MEQSRKRERSDIPGGISNQWVMNENQLCEAETVISNQQNSEEMWSKRTQEAELMQKEEMQMIRQETKLIETYIVGMEYNIKRKKSINHALVNELSRPVFTCIQQLQGTNFLENNAGNFPNSVECGSHKWYFSLFFFRVPHHPFIRHIISEMRCWLGVAVCRSENEFMTFELLPTAFGKLPFPINGLFSSRIDLNTSGKNTSQPRNHWCYGRELLTQHQEIQSGRKLGNISRFSCCSRCNSVVLVLSESNLKNIECSQTLSDRIYETDIRICERINMKRKGKK